MYTIQANPSGTRSIEVSNENLRTIEKYALFRHLIDSTGIVDEAVLDKLKLNIRSLIASQEEDSKDLLDLCIDVIYHNNMKAFGLQQLIKLYLTWLSSPETEGNCPLGSSVRKSLHETKHRPAQTNGNVFLIYLYVVFILFFIYRSMVKI